MRVEAIVADLDGTLVDAGYAVSPATIDALETLKAERIPLVIATGRIPQGLDELPSVARYAQVAVCCSGSIGVTPTGAVWRERLEGPAIAEVIDRSLAAGAGVAGYDGRNWHQTDTYYRLAPQGGYGVPRSAITPDRLAETRCITMSVLHGSADALSDLAAGLSGLVGVGLSRVAGLEILDITAPAIDKGVGVLRALNLISVEPASTISFGDMPNDMPMFAVTGRAYAVGLAHNVMRVAVDEVLAPVERDGFAAKIADLSASGWVMPEACRVAS